MNVPRSTNGTQVDLLSTIRGVQTKSDCISSVYKTSVEETVNVDNDYRRTSDNRRKSKRVTSESYCQKL